MLAHVLSHLLLQEPWEEGAMIATFQMRTLWPREMQETAQSYTEKKQAELGLRGSEFSQG